MRKMLKVFLTAALILTAVAAALVVKILTDMRARAEDQAMMVKPDDELLGRHFYMPREGGEAVDLNLYIPDDGEKHPLVLNIHGGAFIAGDADTLDTQSSRISGAWNVSIAAVNYKLAVGGYDIAYGTREIVDTVKYMIQNAEEFHIDTSHIFVMGYSAGAYHAMAAVIQLAREGIQVGGQILCYGFLRDVIELYEALTEEQKQMIPPSLFVIAEGDPIGEGSLLYEETLRENGIPTEIKRYAGAMHGFIEENNPEYAPLHSHASMSPEQEVMARDAETYIGRWISDITAE